ncbi:Hpt domain-containing protein [Allorhizobium taibaishanense]|uniref:HPt (Histidine-containing phosphotransfer) domain-containing protein n=1 Tax=Allorhizobium taibaishanense TaxID=887144 RepID=A0A1Q9AB35_9HYPH|nr:Hpt domain-containing protein [Allorhizobium taibaishanense]MBB4010311.1 HPt (histidine-containing phosphotransfer) domain-containing protein [Allorhizobium taibaishanense]OLP52088.1 transcriptional regulator [Allorhizobium taibaishanense]
MAAVNIAFEAPEVQSGLTPSKERPIDLVHLATQTMGDKALEIEVLQMFAKQARSCLQGLAAATADPVAIAHRLKGAASAVGAFKVAHAAGEVESKGADAARIAAITATVVEAEHFILKLCRI